MKTRWKILIISGIFLALLIASMIFSARWQPENAVEAYKKVLRERGEKLEISEVTPPPVPAQSNSLDAVEAGFNQLGSGFENIPDAMTMVAPGRAMIGWACPEACGYDFTNSWDDFADALFAYQPALDLFHRVLERPVLDFQLDYSKGVAMPITHLSLMKRAAQKLDAAAICELHFGDTGAATTNILTMLALVQRSASDGLLISHLVRIAMASIAVSPTWELLQHTNVTDAQLVALQQAWMQLNFLDDAQSAFVMERASMTAEIEKLRNSPEQFDMIYGASSPMASYGRSSSSGSGLEAWTEQLRYGIGEAMWRSSWSYSDELRTLKGDTIVLETLRTMRTNQSQFYKVDLDAMNKRLSSLGITNAGEAFFRALNIPDFLGMMGRNWWGASVNKTIRIETARRIVIAAIALKRFQQQAGHWPQTLGELVPKCLPAVPVDPYDGKLLRYHPNADGTYLLYAVGEDGVDNGGDPTNTASSSSNPQLYWQNAKARDWVWPQPATAAEIQYFYEHPPK